MAPTGEVQVGDTIEVRATLTNPGQDYDQIFLIKISEREKPKEKQKKKKMIMKAKLAYQI